uniref:Uncharacterized protein n=1 Tax=Peromyscus maniculatus bairdii TaxID=230844 RepID=A0A8C8W7Z9_PERMB
LKQHPPNPRIFFKDGYLGAVLSLKETCTLEDGYCGVEVQITLSRTEIIILATSTRNVLGDKGGWIRELLFWKRFVSLEGSKELYVEKIAIRGSVIALPREKILPTSLIPEHNDGKSAHPSCPNHHLQHNRVLATASGGWMLH